MSTIWVNRPKNHYIITADGETFHADAYRLDYKKTILDLRKAGYKKINICCIGKHHTY